MRNNLTGIIISALIHVALFSWAYAVNNAPIKINDTSPVMLSVSLFEEKLTPPTPMTPEFSGVPIPKVNTIKKAPLIKIANKTLDTIAPTKRAIVKPNPEPIEDKIKKDTITKAIKNKRFKKKVTIKKKVASVKKATKKKVISRKLVRKKKVFTKKKIVRKAIKKKVASKKSQIAKKKSKKPSANAPKRQRVVKRPVKRAKAPQKHVKRGGVYSNKLSRQRQQQLARQRALATQRATQQSSRQKTVTAKPSIQVAAHSAQNAKLTQQYKVHLQQLIASKKQYPKAAKRRRQQGKVTVSFRIRHSGVITDIRIVKGARSTRLNQATIAAIKKASGKLAYPNGMNKKSLTLTITLSYILS